MGLADQLVFGFLATSLELCLQPRKKGARLEPDRAADPEVRDFSGTDELVDEALRNVEQRRDFSTVSAVLRFATTSSSDMPAMLTDVVRHRARYSTVPVLDSCPWPWHFSPEILEAVWWRFRR